MGTRPIYKPVFDTCTATIAIILTSPVLALASLAILLFDGRPILFRQVRPGLLGRPFTIYKLRTMRDGSGEDGVRLTRLGGILRATSIDELPTLWNVLRGEMSLVGPRPLLMAYLDRYTPEQARRHLVKPGITGLAQVSGRNAVDWDRRLALDTWYVDNGGWMLDLKILTLTFCKVLGMRGVNAAPGVTMPEFAGTRRPWE